jgi:hypothetical protein
VDATEDPASRDAIYSTLDGLFIDEEIPQAMLKDPDGKLWEEQPLRLGSSIGIWMLINAILFHFVAPFVITGKPYKALAFIGLTALSYYSEELLEGIAPDAFFLPRGSLVAIMMLATLILVNTVFFDSIYQGATEKYHLCPFCKGEVGDGSFFCPSCGAEQQREV